MKRYEIHLHTKYSPCSSLKPSEILKIAKAKGMTGVAVTDHNTIKGALEVKRLNKDKDFEVIIGEEVSTDIGHVLVYYVRKEIKKGKAEQVLKEAKEQGAIVVLAHPYNNFSEKISKVIPLNRRNARLDDRLLARFDAIEIFNSRCFSSKDNIQAAKLAKKHAKPGTGGSDAHFKNEIGNTVVEFDDKYNFREALLGGKLKVVGGKKTALFNHFRSKMLSVFS